MLDLPLTAKQERLLHDQAISADEPGVILKDFGMLLEVLAAEGERGVAAAGKYNLLSMDLIGALDRRLSRPLRLELKRPQLKSHPYLQGLHLLLRASGLARVDGTGAKARLVLDPDLHAQWQGLNTTEQYCSLLQAWLLHGRAEMVGEKDGHASRFLLDCVSTWQALPPAGERYRLNQPTFVYVHAIGRQFYLLALMDLFGLVEVEHPAQAVQPWCPAGLKHRPFGDALFTLLAQGYFDSLSYPRFQEDAAQAWGRWQPLLQPYFPDWRRALAPPEPQARQGVFVFRMSAHKFWCRIAMPAQATLDDLVGCILKSLRFDSDHLYQFTYRDRFGGTVRAVHPACEEGPWTSEVRIGALPLEPGQSMDLLYDFGDSWQFQVALEGIEPPAAGQAGKKPRILQKHGTPPQQYPDWDE